MRAKIQKISKYAPSLFQGKLDLNARRAVFSLTSEHPGERVLQRAFFIAMIALAILYTYFVGVTALNVIARKEARAETQILATAVSQLERDYFALSQGIGPEDGARLGLSPVQDTTYVHRTGNAAIAEQDSNAL